MNQMHINFEIFFSTKITRTQIFTLSHTQIEIANSKRIVNK